jgi:hypothetical protein
LASVHRSVKLRLRYMYVVERQIWPFIRSWIASWQLLGVVPT